MKYMNMAYITGGRKRERKTKEGRNRAKKSEAQLSGLSLPFNLF